MTDLLRPQEKVFTKKKRDYGWLSVGVAILTVALLVPVYASFTGAIVPVSWAMVIGGVLGALLFPWVLARRLRSRGPRLFSLFNVLLALVFYLLLGGTTDRALEQHGMRPFESLARAVGHESSHSQAVVGTGRAVVGALRYLTVTGRDGSKEPPDQPDEDDGSGAEDPSVDSPGEPLEAAAESTSGEIDGSLEGAGPVSEIHAHVESRLAEDTVNIGSVEQGDGAGTRRSTGSGTYTVLPAPKRAVVEVPIQRDGGTFAVGAIVNGRIPADFLFDTGADLTAITPALARRLGMDPEALPDRRAFLTAGGRVEDPVTRLESIAIDSAEVRDLEVVVCTRCSSNLLGRNYQRHFRVEIDGARGMLRLDPR